jgi:hypothetical protein
MQVNEFAQIMLAYVCDHAGIVADTIYRKWCWQESEYEFHR